MFTAEQKSQSEAIQTLASGAMNLYTKTTAAETITAAQFVDGLVDQSAAQAAHNLTTPTAALAIAAMQDPKIGDMFDFWVVNSAGGAIVTVVGGTGVTLKGPAIVAIGGAAMFRGYLVSLTAISLYCISSGV